MRRAAGWSVVPHNLEIMHMQKLSAMMGEAWWSLFNMGVSHSFQYNGNDKQVRRLRGWGSGSVWLPITALIQDALKIFCSKMFLWRCSSIWHTFYAFHKSNFICVQQAFIQVRLNTSLIHDCRTLRSSLQKVSLHTSIEAQEGLNAEGQYTFVRDVKLRSFY